MDAQLTWTWAAKGAARHLAVVLTGLIGLSGMVVASTSVASASQHKVAIDLKAKAKKAPKKGGNTSGRCNESSLKHAVKNVITGSFTVDSFGCSTNPLWAYIVVTSGGTQEVDALGYSTGIGVWVPDNTGAVCIEHKIPKDIRPKVCNTSAAELQ